ncbi:MAG TPA: chorismate synthase, partial [Lapidilactobacillus dextrinicus]|nr:chorismate synthase [Lapidilactobacillus dextrinicus]
PTQPTGSPTIDVQTKESAQATVERSDTTAVPAASVIAEAMTAITIMQAFCDMFGADDFTRIKRNYQAYLDEIND